MQTLKKPNWIRIQASINDKKFHEMQKILRNHKLFTVCEEASCPNIWECFNKKTATFMIMGYTCTRRCTFCDVDHGKPYPINIEEPTNIAQVVVKLKLKYVVITSVNRDDIKDGGAKHFSKCIKEIRILSPNTKIEILTPDFKRNPSYSLSFFSDIVPNVFSHNVETVPRLYKEVRPGFKYENSLNLLKKFKKMHSNVLTKSSLMVGLGEKEEEVINVMHDLRANNVNMLTIGQYLQPSSKHYPVHSYINPNIFKVYKEKADKMGFLHSYIGPMIRSSYHADLQAYNAKII